MHLHLYIMSVSIIVNKNLFTYFNKSIYLLLFLSLLISCITHNGYYSIVTLKINNKYIYKSTCIQINVFVYAYSDALTAVWTKVHEKHPKVSLAGEDPMYFLISEN